jgi:hypothetical protein
VFVAGVLIARISGFWQNSISPEEYLYHMQHMDNPEYYHNRGQVPDYDGTRWEKQSNVENNAKPRYPRIKK